MVSQTRANFNTANKKQDEFFSDFMVDLSVHPITNELNRNTNENAIKRSIRNILLTNHHERLFNPTFGGNLSKLLFEPMSVATADAIKHTINDTIIDNEPRVKLSNIEVFGDELNHSYRINLYFLIINSEKPSAMSITLYRVR